MPNTITVVGTSAGTTTYRTTVLKVRTIGGFPTTLDLEPYIETAYILVTDIENLNHACMSPAKLEMIERWLAAHFAKLQTPSLTSKSIAGASASFEGSASGQGLSLTRFGQQALALDCTGHLRNLDKPKAQMKWLGTEP